MAVDFFQTWIGYGVKVGGSLFVVGVESADGLIYNLGFPTHSHSLNITGIRIGPGLGGGGGLIAMIVFNCGNIQNLSDTNTNDWSVNIALGPKWKEIMAGLGNYKFFTTMATLGGKLSQGTPADITSIRNSLSYLWSADDILSMDSAPKIVTLDIPGLGYSQEISASYIIGTITIGELNADTESYQQEPYNDGGSGAGAG